MNRSAIRIALAGLLVGTLLASTVAEAQWVLLARRAVGRVEQMSQQQPNGGAAYDTASVMIAPSRFCTNRQCHNFWLAHFPHCLHDESESRCQSPTS
jgi:hypothetical protein